MKVQRLQVESQMARIRVESQMASLSIMMPKRTMSIQEQRAKMLVQQLKGSVELDMKKFRDNIGLKTVRTIIEESAAKARAEVAQSIREAVSEADYIGTLPAQGNPIAEVARQNMLESTMPEMGSGKVKDNAIRMEGKPGKVAIQWAKHELQIKWDKFQKPVITVEPKASVHVEMVQEPRVEFTVVEMYIPPETGNAVDQEV